MLQIKHQMECSENAFMVVANQNYSLNSSGIVFSYHSTFEITHSGLSLGKCIFVIFSARSIKIVNCSTEISPLTAAIML